MKLPLMIRSWPTCILHLDADAFFASVEQSINPKLKGKPVVAGAERGIVAAASYEAKKYGVKTGMRSSDAKRLCPGLICVSSDYETYSIFSKRIFAIMRRFTPIVEEYSIDEAFADLSGLRRMHHASFSEIAKRMKEEVERELGITVSVGVSLTKSLAKLASDFRKPSGHVIVPGRVIHQLLERTPLQNVWGFGPNTVALLQKLGLKTALDFVLKPEAFAKQTLGKIGVELHRELSGNIMYPVKPEAKTTYASISKTKTFTPPSTERDYVYAQALRNLESACIKARRYSLVANRLSLFLKRQDFKTCGIEVKLTRNTSSTLDLAVILSDLFHQVYKSNTLYRATGVILGGLEGRTPDQLGLFDNTERILKSERASQCIDEINAKFGKHKIHLAQSLPAFTQHAGTRGQISKRKSNLLPGETFRQHLGVPLFHPALLSKKAI